MIKKFVSILLFSSFVNLTTTALAEEYTPPVDSKPPSGNTRSTGGRSSCGRSNSNIPLTLLAPFTHVGQTTAEYPVLAWYVPFSDRIQIELSIYEEDEGEFNSRQILVQQIRMESKQGIMKATLPQNRPGLKTGNRYLWEISIMCEPANRTRDLVARAEIDRVATPANADKKHLWYDLLAASLRTSDGNRPSRESIDLIEQLAALEGENRQRGAYFKQIVTLYSNPFDRN